MKKVILTLVIFATSVNMMGLERSKVCEYARFLSDRMAHELGLTTKQYNDCFEINYDFIDDVGNYLDGMESGDAVAIDNYYNYLDYRNEDLSYVLTSNQYSRFASTECFYRPFCIYNGAWAFRPYMVYTSRNYFYMSTPSGYSAYSGAHARRYYSSGYYVGRYSSTRYTYTSIRKHSNYNTYRSNDFGVVASGHGNSGYTSSRTASRSTVSQRKSTVSQSKPATSQSKPATSQSKPATSQSKPATSQSKPATSQSKPATSQSKPATSQSKPATSQSKPVTSQSKPATSQSKPVTSQSKPATSQSKPATSQSKPATSQSKSNGSTVKKQSGTSNSGGGGVSRRGRG